MEGAQGMAEKIATAAHRPDPPVLPVGDATARMRRAEEGLAAAQARLTALSEELRLAQQAADQAKFEWANARQALVRSAVTYGV